MVEGSKEEGRAVYYVEADSKEQAIRTLAARYDRNRILSQARKVRYAAERFAAGLCVGCGKRAHRPDLRTCETCKNSSKGGAAKRAKTPEEKAAREAKRLKYTRDWHAKGGRRLSVLREVLRSYEADPKQFKSWLIFEIDKLNGKA